MRLHAEFCLSFAACEPAKETASVFFEKIINRINKLQLSNILQLLYGVHKGVCIE